MKTIVHMLKVKSYSSNLDERTMKLHLYNPLTTVISVVMFKGTLTPEGAKFFYQTYLNQSDPIILVTWDSGEVIKLQGVDRTLYYKK